MTNSAGSSEGGRNAKSVQDLNLQRLSRLSVGASAGADVASSPGQPIFQFLEHELPYNRRPLTDKVRRARV